MDARERAIRAAQAAFANRGRDILILEMRQLVDWVDYVVIATGTSRRQILSITDEIKRSLAAVGDGRPRTEGYEKGVWVAMDFGDLIVHVFNDEKREYYQLEHLWADAPRVEWEPDPLLVPARSVAEGTPYWSLSAMETRVPE